MPIRDRLMQAARALMGVSEYAASAPVTGTTDEATAAAVRRAQGGQLQVLPTTRTRWYTADLETATLSANAGDMSWIGQLSRAMRSDGLIHGLRNTRTAGLVALPKRFRGDDRLVQMLTDESGTRTLFDEMFPPAELALLADDGVVCGIGVAEMVPVVGRDHPMLVRLEPEFLRYRWNEDRWYFRSVAGELPIEPGDGRWVLHRPGGRMCPWQHGLWPALGDAYINKVHAKLHRANYTAKLANPARVAKSPAGATDGVRAGFLSKVIAWGINTVFELPPGYDVSLLESNGRGWQVFDKQIETSDLEVMIALAGQVVTVTGGTGFANADIHQTIRADLIKNTADDLAYTIDTQGIPQWAVQVGGVEALEQCPRVEWITQPEEDQSTAADTMIKVADAITKLATALQSGDVRLAPDVVELAARFGIPTKALVARQDASHVTLTPSDTAKVVTVDEARESQGLEPIGDDRTLAELDNTTQSDSTSDSLDAPNEAPNADE